MADDSILLPCLSCILMGQPLKGGHMRVVLMMVASESLLFIVSLSPYVNC